MNKQNLQIYLLFITYNNASKKIARWYKTKKNKNKNNYKINLTNKELYKLIKEINYC